MKRTLIHILVFIIPFLLSFSSSENPLDRLIAGFTKYLDELPQEKVYVHFDRPYYTSGETIWFKAYLTAGAFHMPSWLSRTIYIELINAKGQLVTQQKLFSISGSATGDIVLSDSLESGNYLVRAYTHWMENGEEEYFFHRAIKVWNREDHDNGITSHDKLQDIRFFPEGGDMVSGVLSKVAFKGIGPDGLGREVKGKIVDESSVVVCAFESNFLGMGAFSIIPEKGKTYRAVVDDYQMEVPLPPIKESGLVMSVRNSPGSDDVFVRLQATDYTNLKTVYILAQTRGVVCYAARMDLHENVIVAKIPKSKFPAGVAQITITDDDGIPLSERLVFVNELEQFSLEITSDKTAYAPRELVTLHIKATDGNGTPVIADLSLSVCDDQQVLPDENAETICTYLLLSSELKGHIESPAYYFNPRNKDRAEDLDYLMLTQGWRRFTFKKALQPKWEEPEYKIEKGLTIKGKMVDKNNNKPITDGKVTYLAIDPVVYTSVVRTNSFGDFELSDIIYFDSAQAVLQGETKKGSKLIKLIIDSAPDFPTLSVPLFRRNKTLTPFERAFIAKSTERKNIDKAYDFDEKVVVLKEVEVYGKKEDPSSNNNSIYGKGSASLQVAGNPGMENQSHPLQLLQGRIPGVQVAGGGQNWSVSIRGGGAPLILVDDIPVPIENLSSLSVHDIESIDVWKGGDAAVFGIRGYNGAIAFHTKRGVGFNPPKEGVFTLAEIGFQIERQFYSPKYNSQKPEYIKPDKRATLFWAPLVQTDSAGRASVSFYNHDLETIVTAVAQGISITGKPAAATFKYVIRKN